jgi:hypothetical protein
MSFDRVIVSATDDGFREFWPLVSTAWRKWFPSVKVTLALIAGEDRSITDLQRHGEVIRYAPIHGMPPANQAKLARYLAAGQYPDDVCLIHDIDTVPLQATYYAEITAARKPGHLLLVGRERYDGTPHEGKCPAGCTTGEGRLFAELFRGGLWELIGMHAFDGWEDPWLPSERFSDESTMRSLLDGSSVPAQRVPQGFDWRRDCPDRSWWSLDLERLYGGGYIEANMPRPPHGHPDKMLPIAAYIYGRKVMMEEILG